MLNRMKKYFINFMESYLTVELSKVVTT